MKRIARYLAVAAGTIALVRALCRIIPPRDSPLPARRPARRPALRLVQRLSFAAFYDDILQWNPSPWFWFDLGGVIGFVYGALQGAFQWVGNHVATAVLALVNAAFTVGGVITQSILGTFQWVYAEIDKLAGKVTDFGFQMAQDIWNVANQLRREFQQIAEQLIGFALDGIWSTIDFLIQGAIDVARALVDTAFNLVSASIGRIWETLAKLGGLIDDPLEAIWDFFWDRLLNVADQLVRTGLNLIFTGFGDVVDVLKGAWHFLEWIATHADDFTIDALEAAFSVGSSSFADRVMAAFDEHGDDLEARTARWFGG